MRKYNRQTANSDKLTMKNLLLATTFAIILSSQTVNAQSFVTVKNHNNLDYLLTAQQSAVRNHTFSLDKLQQETEDLILAIMPASVVSMAKLINKKFPVTKSRKAKSKIKSESC